MMTHVSIGNVIREEMLRVTPLATVRDQTIDWSCLEIYKHLEPINIPMLRALCKQLYLRSWRSWRTYFFFCFTFTVQKMNSSL